MAKILPKPLPKTYTRTPAEVFEQLEQLEKEKDKVTFLRDNASFAVLSILQGAFDDKVVFDIPEGAPPFTRDTNPQGYSLTRINNTAKLFVVLTKSSKLPPVKKEKKFIEILESVHEKDADVIIAMKDKKLTELYPSITEKLVLKAFPAFRF